MPAPTKIVDENEVLKWFQQGKTYAWMVQQYKELYGRETSISMWANYRRRHLMQRRITRDDDLIPWHVKEEHRYRYDLTMLRAEARRRDGKELSADMEQRLEAWLRDLKAKDAVVYYNPDTEEGFFLVPREESDDDLIRRPPEKTTKRPRAT
ncbi:hypothetical protein [Streptomyces sp. NPDC006134]|uniref:hypothetical protein n=1 Tax=Streptomyces sp. NPDC006134 TaxID=3154467 RepID=UPI00340A19AE